VESIRLEAGFVALVPMCREHPSERKVCEVGGLVVRKRHHSAKTPRHPAPSCRAWGVLLLYTCWSRGGGRKQEGSGGGGEKKGREKGRARFVYGYHPVVLRTL